MAPVAERLVARPTAAAQLDDARLLEYGDRDLVSLGIDNPGHTVNHDGTGGFNRNGETALRFSHAVWIPRAASSAA